jgi:hypothetical protein
MARPSWQDIENAYEEPRRVIDALPDSPEYRTERNSAKRCLDQSYAYVKEIRERVRHQEGED